MHLFGIYFQTPLWLLAIPALLLWLLWLYYKRSFSNHWSSICDAHLLKHLLKGQKTRTFIVWFTLLLAWIVACIALAGPSFKKAAKPLYQSSFAHVFVLNLSNSMLAQDLKPNRLSIARFALLDLLNHVKDSRAALVVFAKQAYVVSPLTNDTKVIAAQVPLLTPDLMPIQDNNPTSGLKQALALLKQGRATQGQVILITDSAGAQATQQMATNIKSQGYQLDVLALGTAQGAPIPQANGKFTMANNQVVLSQVSASKLRTLAQAGNGQLYLINHNNPSIDARTILSQQTGKQMSASDKKHKAQHWHNQGPYIALLLIPLLLFAFRRGYLNPMALVFISGTSLPSIDHAFNLDSFWRNDNQQGRALLQQKDYQQAVKTFQSPLWQGYAYYRDQQYQKAADAFAQQNTALAQYNLGNALAKLGQYQKAIAAYEQAIKLDAQNQDARFNKALLEKLLKQQQQQSKQSESQQSQSKQNKPQDQNQPSQSQAQQKPNQNQNQNNQAQSKPNKSDSKPQNAQNSPPNPDKTQPSQKQAQQNDKKSDNQNKPSQAKAKKQAEQNKQAQAKPEQNPKQQESKQALSQWLRQVPDDPGGLLRRDFLRQEQLRQQRGQE